MIEGFIDNKYPPGLRLYLFNEKNAVLTNHILIIIFVCQ